MRRLGANLEKELDFRIEAKNALRLSECMANNPCIAVPESIPEVNFPQDLERAYESEASGRELSLQYSNVFTRGFARQLHLF